ncbi:MAG: UDP-N-acetylmuramate--L-alanine ligase [Bradymonadia bacterium]|jgi:UDP-N-acetylmuramate--alanine ligase
MQENRNISSDIPQRLHFIGIAGAGMSSLARYMLEAGYDVRGSDCRDGEALAELRGAGARVYTTQVAENLGDADCVIYSSAIPVQNPERAEAQRRGIAIKRGHFLAKITQAHPCSIAVCGTHGKGTTAGAILAICQSAKLRTSYILGAPIKGEPRAARYVQNAEYLIVEVDESDRTHELHRPSYLLINNIEADHLNVYGSLQKIVDSFAELIKNCLAHGTRILFQYDGVGAADLLKQIPKSPHLYLAIWSHKGSTEPIDWDFTASHKELKPSGLIDFRLQARDAQIPIRPALGGLSNAYNLFAAASLAKLLGIAPQHITSALAHYPGLIDRCQHSRNDARQISLVTDYASHPTSIKNDILWQKQYEQRVIAVFQPYRYSLCTHHWHELAQSLALADHIALAPLDPAGEAHVEGISSDALALKIQALGRDAYAFPSMRALEEHLAAILQANDCLLIFGGGPIFEMGHRLLS